MTMEAAQDKAALENIGVAPGWETLTPEQREEYRKSWEEEDQYKTRVLMAEHKKNQLHEAWEKLCPPIYRDPCDISLIPGDKAMARMIMSWRYCSTGFVVTGPTGQGKTRTVWHALKIAHFHDYKIRALDGIGFANEASAAAYSPDATEKWMARMTEPDILFIDDLAKRFTKTSGQLLFGLIERRVSRKLPIIITTNLTAPQLETLIDDPELARPLVRRLREFCNPVTL